MRRRRNIAVLAAAMLAFTACSGSGDDVSDDSFGDVGASSVAEPTDDSSDATPVAEQDELADDAEPTEVGALEDEPAPDEPAVEPDGQQPDVTEVDAPAPVASDAAATPAELGGRSFAETVDPEAQFDSNPFPDLVVDDVGRASKANLANILPSDRPVLLWTWAPH